jgi:hypothetical protein
MSVIFNSKATSMAKYVISYSICSFFVIIFFKEKVDGNDITVLVSGQQKHYFHLWGLKKPIVAFATRDFYRPHS